MNSVNHFGIKRTQNIVHNIVVSIETSSMNASFASSYSIFKQNDNKTTLMEQLRKH